MGAPCLLMPSSEMGWDTRWALHSSLGGSALPTPQSLYLPLENHCHLLQRASCALSSVNHRICTAVASQLGEGRGRCVLVARGILLYGVTGWWQQAVPGGCRGMAFEGCQGGTWGRRRRRCGHSPWLESCVAEKRHTLV